MKLLSALRFAGALAVAALAFSGCSTPTAKLFTETVVLTNATPPTLPENPSGLYTITVRARPVVASVIRDTLRVTLTIDGQEFAMRPSPLGRDLWEYDHAIARGRSEASYFVTANFEIVAREGRRLQRERFTDLQKLRIVNRFGLALEAQRGPVGAAIAIVGRGFQPEDQVVVGETPAQTRFVSANSLQFVIPAVEADQIHPVKVVSGAGDFAVGHIRVDRGMLAVAPQALTLRKGERRTFSVTLPSPASGAGQVLSITTDIPASVVMAEAVVPAGMSQIAVPLIGGEAGTGSLFIEAPGFSTARLAITVIN